MGILLNILPIDLQNKIIKNVSDEAKVILSELKMKNEYKINCNKEACYTSKYANYIADTPEKVIRKFIDVYKGIKEDTKREL